MFISESKSTDLRFFHFPVVHESLMLSLVTTQSVVKLTDLKSCAYPLHILWSLTCIYLFSHVVLKAVAESCSHAVDGSGLNSQDEESTTCRIYSHKDAQAAFLPVKTV